jgi:hypothetical protein
MLLKFFINSHSTAHLRGMAEEFGESTNAIRHELNNLSRASYLIAEENGRTIQYRANTDHPLYPEIKNLIHKYLGLDKIVDHILSKLGKLYYAFIVGDYARGKDSGVIELVLVGDIDAEYLKVCVDKVEKLISRKIRVDVRSLEAHRQNDDPRLATALVMWTEK